MKKLLSLIVAAVFSISLSACAARDNNMVERTRVRNNNGVDVERLAQPNSYGNRVNYNNTTTAGIYRDGVYTGFGNVHSGGNEKATVIIRNGRIAEIGLTNVGIQNENNYDIGNGKTINNQGRSLNLTDDGLGMSNPPAANNPAGDQIGRMRTPAGTTTGPIADDESNEVRTKLIGRMIQEQSPDVTIDYGNANMGKTVDNWKIAVRRALDKAR